MKKDCAIRPATKMSGVVPIGKGINAGEYNVYAPRAVADAPL